MEQGYIYIHNNIFPTLVAISEQEQQQGLMGQEWPPPIMSFFYDSPKINKFWMHRTPSPLDIVFCYKNKISQICYGEPFSTKIIGAEQFSDLIIEFPYGTVNTSEIKIGHSVGLLSPSPKDLLKVIAKNRTQFVKF